MSLTTAGSAGRSRFDPFHPASVLSPMAHTVVRNGRRVLGRAQLHRVSVTGQAPNAVISALKSAAIGRPMADERAWIKRIELIRALLATSPEQLEILDFGAGSAHRFDNGAVATRHTTTRSLGQMTRSSKPPRWAYLLFRLVRELTPASCLEMGACVGISASYQAAALELNNTGRLITLEGAPTLAARSARTLEELLLGHRAEVRLGRFADTLSDSLSQLRPLGMAFIDGHHVERATLDYAEAILGSAGPEALLVFDDINWSDGMRNAWSTIVEDDRYALTVDLRSVGLAVVSATATERQRLCVAYY